VCRLAYTAALNGSGTDEKKNRQLTGGDITVIFRKNNFKQFVLIHLF
jgi:hypothetical protein